MENAKKFFEELAKTEEAKALFAAIDKPDTEEELVAIYVDIAKKLGVELTAEEVKEYLAADNADGAELDDEELSQLAGGASGCWASYDQRQNCWTLDACDILVKRYTGYYCDKILKDGSMMNPSNNAVTSAFSDVADVAVDVAEEFK